MGFPRLRQEPGGGYASRGHVEWGGGVSVRAPLAEAGLAGSVARVRGESGSATVGSRIMAAALSPARFRNAEHLAGVRNDSEDDSDEDIHPMSTNHIHQLLPRPLSPIVPVPSRDQVSIPTARDEDFTYLTDQVTCQLLSICRERGILQLVMKGERVARITASVDAEKRRTSKAWGDILRGHNGVIGFTDWMDTDRNILEWETAPAIADEESSDQDVIIEGDGGADGRFGLSEYAPACRPHYGRGHKFGSN